MADTAKVNKFNDSGQLIELFGDPKIKIESTENIIIFPGGSISVARVTGGYWAHIEINQEPHNPDSVGGSKVGQIERIRLDLNEGYHTIELPDGVYHFAVKVKIEPSIVNNEYNEKYANKGKHK